MNNLKVFDWKFDKKEFIRILLATTIFCLLAHGFRFFNSDFSHDSLSMLNYSKEYQIQMIQNGRFIRPIYCFFRGTVASPWIAGFLSMVFLSASFYFLLMAFDIKNPLFQVISCGLLVTNYSQTALYATYIHDADCYAFALLLISIGIIFSIKNKKLVATIFYIMSLGLYQAYIQIAVVFILFSAVLRTIDSNNVKMELKRLIQDFIPIVLAMILYFIVHKLTLLVFNLSEFSGYNSISNVFSLSFSSILENIKSTLVAELKWAILPYNNHRLLIGLINVVLATSTIIILIKQCIIQKISSSSIWFLIFILVLIPFGMNCISLLSGITHELTSFSFFICYLFVFATWSKLQITNNTTNLKTAFVIAIFSIIIFDNTVYSNSIYVKKNLEDKATLSVMTRILDRIEQTDGYVPNVTKIAFIGDLDSMEISKSREGFSYSLVGSWYNYSPITSESLQKYLTSYLGYSALFADESTCKFFEKDNKVAAMPSFPNKGCCQIIDGTMIVKLSENKLETESSSSLKDRIVQKLQELWSFQ